MLLTGFVNSEFQTATEYRYQFSQSRYVTESVSLIVVTLSAVKYQTPMGLPWPYVRQQPSSEEECGAAPASPSRCRWKQARGRAQHKCIWFRAYSPGPRWLPSVTVRGRLSDELYSLTLPRL